TISCREWARSGLLLDLYVSVDGPDAQNLYMSQARRLRAHLVSPLRVGLPLRARRQAVGGPAGQGGAIPLAGQHRQEAHGVEDARAERLAISLALQQRALGGK